MLSLLCSHVMASGVEKESKSGKNDERSESTSNKESESAAKNRENHSVDAASESKEREKNLTDQFWQLADPDSSQFTVNKFNYLFYVIYRLKYSDLVDDLSESATKSN